MNITMEGVLTEEGVRLHEPADWAKVSFKQIIEGDEALMARLRTWVNMNIRKGRTVTRRPDDGSAHYIFEAWDR